MQEKVVTDDFPPVFFQSLVWVLKINTCININKIQTKMLQVTVMYGQSESQGTGPGNL